MLAGVRFVADDGLLLLTLLSLFLSLSLMDPNMLFVSLSLTIFLTLPHLSRQRG